MFDLGNAPGSVRSDIHSALITVWRHLAKPGTWWSGRDRVAIAAVARASRIHAEIPPVDLPPPAIEAAALLASTPGATSERWVHSLTDALDGEERYVELLGVATRVVTIDTFCRLMGGPLEPLPEPVLGEPTHTVAEPKPIRTRSWVAVGPDLIPPFTLSLVPDEQAISNQLAWALYMTDAEMNDPDFRRGDLHRTQIELVASTVSYGNECFY
ncbi:MAG TPA: hypothetical protein VLA29_09480 [Acidimicrobiia bacterium]|nr:hypothetical protein [Acidimicrobiia bacterium]